MDNPITTTIADLVDQAMQLATRGQRRRFERRKNLPGYLEKYHAELIDNLLDDERFAAAAPFAFAAMGTQGFTAQTPFQVDGSKLRAILDIILEYGPKLLDLILMFIKAFTCIALCVLSQTAAAATLSPLSLDPLSLAERVSSESGFQQPVRIDASSRHLLAQWDEVAANCPGGICPLPAPVANTTRSANYHAVEVRPIAYQRQWYNRDGMSLRQHAEVMHGHSTEGLSDAQVAALNDADHNTWGHGGHPTTRPQRMQYRATNGGYAYPVAGRVVRGSAVVVRGTARVVTAPVRYLANRQPVRTFIRNRQPVRTVARGVVRGVAALRPVNIASRIRARRGW